MRAGTPPQTVGPFLSLGLGPLERRAIVAEGTANAARIEGHLYDGAGVGVPDGVVEVWQADPAGAFPPDTDRDWTGFGRCLTDTEGAFWFVTVKPGRLRSASGGWQAPHLEILVFARGLLRPVHTRLYFPDEPEANVADPTLSSIPDPEQRSSLVAQVRGTAFRFDIRLQGDAETVFFGS